MAYGSIPPDVDDDQSGRAVERAVFSSIYATLRTNLPSDLMAFLDYPFDSRGGGQDHWPRFPHHSCVLTYLQNFCRDFDITPCLRLEHQVLAIEPRCQAGKSAAGSRVKHPSLSILMRLSSAMATTPNPGCRHWQA